MSRTQQGPTQLYVCNGCENLETHAGSHQSHHKCQDGAWDSVRHTGHGEFLRTPNECTYLKTLIK